MRLEKRFKGGEGVRQILNKSIDLLHKISNRKVSLESAKKELTEMLSAYFLMEQRGEAKLPFLFEELYVILEKLEAGKAPLYEAIMQMNKAVMQFSLEAEEEVSFVSTEFDRSGSEREKRHQMPKAVVRENLPIANVEKSVKNKKEEIKEQMSAILGLKEELEASVSQLNELLSMSGFELKSLVK
ncbi:MAG: hypothetical protein JSR76_01180 [Verrucomicrobia bacterium]|nr:hypothetical protein [Verrucomicrobiota bacterium]